MRTIVRRIIARITAPALVARFVALVSLAALPLLQWGCDQFPATVVAPVFNTGFALPMVDTAITLDQLITDTSFVKKNGNGNVEIVQDFAIPAIRLGDSLSISSMNVNYSTGINGQKDVTERFTNWSTIVIPVRQLAPALPAPPSQSVFPEFTSSINSTIPTPSEVASASFSSGTLRLIVVNSLPVDAEIITPENRTETGVVISTPGEQPWFIPVTGEQRIVPAGGTRGEESSPGGVIRVAMNGKRLTPQSTVTMRVASRGSNGKSVAYTAQSGVTCRFRMENPVIDESEMSLNKQTIECSTDAKLPDDMTISSAEVESFVAKLTLRNDIALAGTGTLTMPQLINSTTGKPYTTTFRIEKKRSTTLNLTSGNENYRLTPDAFDKQNGNVVKTMRMNMSIRTDESATKERVTGNDVLAVTGTIGPVKFRSAEGTNTQSKTVRIQSTTDLSSGDLGTITMTSMKISSMYLTASLRNGSTSSGVLSGSIILRDKKGVELAVLPLSDRAIPASTTTQLEYRFDNVTVREFPSSAALDAVIRTTSGEKFTVGENSTIDGKATMRIPLAVNIQGGAYSTTSAIDIMAATGGAEKSITTADLLLESKNCLPANVGIHIAFFDANKKQLLVLPHSGDAISIRGAENGTAAQSFTRITLTADDIKAITNAKFTTVATSFSSPTDSKQFRTNDFIHLKLNMECNATAR
ncbi:MAG: hypothetical protein JNL32_06250 [Candidatus Kapabacteria bacterium]|nr:hypothetical protein [Candidatus Kapabacteria bacterium]